MIVTDVYPGKDLGTLELTITVFWSCRVFGRRLSTTAATRPPHGERAPRGAPGNTFEVGRQQIFIEPGGRAYGRIRSDVDVGAWHVTADGRYCRTWNVWDKRRSRCYTVYRDGEAFELHLEDRLSGFVLTRRTGNPEHY